MIKLSDIKIERNFFELSIDNFTIESGKIILLLGNSGCGKTTFLKLLSGFIEKCDGKMDFLNSNNSTSLMLQNPINQMITPKVETELKFSLFNQNLTDREIESKIDKIANYFEIEKLMNNNLRELSFGELQKVMLCATFLVDADYYFFDEPTSHLDFQSIKILYNYIQKLKKSGKSVIISSQNFDEYQFADKIIVMDAGNIVEYFDRAEMDKKREILKEYGLKSVDDEIREYSTKMYKKLKFGNEKK
ncbi:MAG: ABC transporter ATP-binding protein [Candidatus Marinimicrobia bacterium]|nr:ABC transporter ATP-binding protein [Candidatus Neomarinimicrobiota bacterium]